jgi:NTE family protein
VLQYHRDFWLNYFKQNNIDYDDGSLEKKDKQKVPNLEVYIVNLYPSLENYLPTDLDSIRDKEIDIKFHDRTKYDEQVANIVTDYIGLVRSAMELALSQAKDKKLLRDEFTRLLKTGGLRSRGRYDKSRTYQDLLEGRFRVKVHRIDRHNDNNTIFGKHADFSSTTIDEIN